MYTDQTLTPKEATRLCALGTLAAGPASYADLALAIRHFISRVSGPTPEIMGHSIELLTYEGLVEKSGGDGDHAILTLTEDGWAELRQLLMARLRAGNTELNHLIVALKFRFLHLLPADEQRRQVDLLIDAGEREIGRLADLKRHHETDPGFLALWLEHDIAAAERRLAWLETLRARLGDAATAETAKAPGEPRAA